MNIDREMNSNLGDISVFAGLNRNQLQNISGLFYFKSFPADKNIFIEKTPGETVFFIVHGTVKLTRSFNDGSDMILDIIGDGEIFGEMSLLDFFTRSASAITLKDSLLCWMGRVSFQYCLDTMPIIAKNLLVTLTNRQRHTLEKFCAYSKLDVMGMVAWCLLDLVEAHGLLLGTGEYLIPLRLTQSDLASLTMASRERINQAIVLFKRAKLITIDDNYQIKVKDKEALGKYCII